uniref:Uncharacterized protein n=1 Tax=Bacteriophage sp. TaxID=38018 RepID=A0A8D9PEW4_9VIRU|nr:MAG TPA: hypothetical protein [Bacteriophage sp.]
MSTDYIFTLIIRGVLFRKINRLFPYSFLG